MKDEDLNAKIAIICGWEISNRNAKDWRHWHVKHPEACPNWDSAGPNLPDYCNDLNAMHEAEKLIPCSEWINYNDAILINLGGPAYLVPARKRAESFAGIMNNEYTEQEKKLAEMEVMKAEDRERLNQGHTEANGPEQWQEFVDKWQPVLGCNSVIEYLRD